MTGARALPSPRGIAQWPRGRSITLLELASTWSAAAVLVSITESLPKAIRFGKLAMNYAVAMVIVGGSTKVMAAWMTWVRGSGSAQAW